MKYITFEDQNGQIVPIIFPDFIDHENMANVMMQTKHWNVQGAGKVGITMVQESVTNRYQFYPCGRSQSLNVGVHEDDEMYLRIMTRV